ncbi:helix-turn-helix transcriptional regulator [Hathewaya limosa]|uniref:Transcriptional regulator with XRE-family HTH domain n=2 Tax=Hathewaya limosa TaxID=1536 RepID=A0ABU0JN27_HATLI|nr:transcriptional regulator with XRE-family HTH domain [Hathewaya limosa]
MDMEILSLGEKIKRKRKELNMTLKDLAGDRITPGQISLVESGKSNPSMDLLEYLAMALNTSVEYLMESEESQAEKICEFFQNIAESHMLENDLTKSEQYIEKALYYAESYNLEYIKAKTLFLTGKIHMIKGERALAQQFFLSANVIFIKLNKYEEIINTFLNLGVITLELKAYHSSCTYFQQAEKVFLDNNVGNDFLIGQIYYYIAYTYFKLEQVDKSIKYSYLAEEKFKQLNNKKDYAKSLLLLSEQYCKKEQLENAINYSKRALAIYKEIQDVKNISEIENNIGKLFSDFGNIDEAFIHLQISKKLRIDNKDPKVIETLITMCENYIKFKNISKSKEILEEIMIEVQNGNKKALVDYYLLKYRIDMQEENFLEAENTLIIALNFSKSMGYLKEAGEISMMIGKFYMDKGNESSAAKYLNEGVEIFKELGIINYL